MYTMASSGPHPYDPRPEHEQSSVRDHGTEEAQRDTGAADKRHGSAEDRSITNDSALVNMPLAALDTGEDQQHAEQPHARTMDPPSVSGGSPSHPVPPLTHHYGRPTCTGQPARRRRGSHDMASNQVHGATWSLTLHEHMQHTRVPFITTRLLLVSSLPEYATSSPTRWTAVVHRNQCNRRRGAVVTMVGKRWRSPRW
jgi:hypothetical protein